MTDRPLTITALLATAREDHPDSVFLRMAEGELTYAQTADRVQRCAGGLLEVGVVPGQPVVLLMHNSLDLVVAWFALARIGAVHVPINTALIGVSLAHVLQVTSAELAIVDVELLDAVERVADSVARLQHVIVRGQARASRFRTTSFDQLDAGAPPAPAAVDDLAGASVLFTSGTSGVSKGCTLSHRYLVRQGQLHAANLRLDASDVLYAPFPLFHVDAATLTVVAALSVGATAAIGRRFSASRFWDEVRRFDASVFNFLGATLTILWKQPQSATDRDHRVRLAWGVPMPDWKSAWHERFGFPLYQLYGLTDAGICAYDVLDSDAPARSCGRVLPEYDLVIVDTVGHPVAPGTVGEITIVGREPGLVMNGYWAMAQETAHAFRGGRFHTGDLGALDLDGYLYFHGRASDSIRRRGENISAYEVEQGLLAHPDIIEAAALGVPSELTEEDVKAFVVTRPGSALTPAQIHAHCLATMPPFMVPRYLEIVPHLPKTPTQKIEKYRLAARPNVAETWDAEDH